MTVKFHKEAITLYGSTQLAENTSVVNKYPTGRISTSVGDATVTGTSTAFTTEVAVGSYLYTMDGYIIGRVLSIASNTSLELEDVVPASATDQSEGVMGINTAITQAARTITGVLTVAANATAATGTNFDTDSLAPGDALYNGSGVFIGVIDSVDSATALTLRYGAEVAVSGAAYTAFQGKYQTGLGPKNALAVINMTYSTELTSEAFNYTGDELDRDELTSITDQYAKVEFETLLPRLGTIAGGDPVASEVPKLEWFQAVGGAIVLSTGSGGYAEVTNSLSSNSFLTIEARRSSPDLVSLNEQKAFIITDARGTIDLDLAIGSKARLKFSYMGNLADTVQKFTIVPDYEDQKITLAPNVKSSVVTLSGLAIYTDENLPSVPGSSNICFDKLTAPNLFGFDYQRFLTSCVDGWSKGAVPTDVTITITEDAADATYNPYDYLETNHRLTLRWGSTAGAKIELDFEKLQLAKITDNTTVATFAGQDLGFRNIGYTTIKFY